MIPVDPKKTLIHYFSPDQVLEVYADRHDFFQKSVEDLEAETSSWRASEKDADHFFRRLYELRGGHMFLNQMLDIIEGREDVWGPFVKKYDSEFSDFDDQTQLQERVSGIIEEQNKSLFERYVGVLSELVDTEQGEAMPYHS